MSRNGPETQPRPTAPAFLVVGAPKSGTTSLFEYLRQHPALSCARVKEPLFFCQYDDFSGPKSRYRNTVTVRDPDEYRALFDVEDIGAQRLTFEMSTDYLSCEAAPQNIFRWNPEAKIVMLLRNPVDRAFSEHMHLVRDGLEELSFREAIEAEVSRREQGFIPLFWHVRRSLYAEAIERYLALFPRENILFLTYDEFCNDSAAVVQKIFSFLGVEAIAIDTARRLNTSGRPKRPGFHKALTWMDQIPNSNPLKSAARRLIGPDARSRMREWYYSRNLDKETISEADRSYMASVFHDDIVATAELTRLNLSAWLARPGDNVTEGETLPHTPGIEL